MFGEFKVRLRSVGRGFLGLKRRRAENLNDPKLMTEQSRYDLVGKNAQEPNSTKILEHKKKKKKSIEHSFFKSPLDKQTLKVAWSDSAKWAPLSSPIYQHNDL